MFFNYVSGLRLAFCSAHYQSSFTSHFTQTGTLRLSQSPSLQLQMFFMSTSYFTQPINRNFVAACRCCLVLPFFCLMHSSLLHSSIKHEVKGMKNTVSVCVNCQHRLTVEQAVWFVITILNGYCVGGNSWPFSSDNRPA